MPLYQALVTLMLVCAVVCALYVLLHRLMASQRH